MAQTVNVNFKLDADVKKIDLIDYKYKIFLRFRYFERRYVMT